MYREVYKPGKMILVARCALPPDVRKNLEVNGIMVGGRIIKIVLDPFLLLEIENHHCSYE